MITTRTVALTLAAAFLAGAVLAQPLAVPPGRWWERPRIAEAVALTSEQKQKLEANALDHARAMIDLKAAVEKAGLDLRAAFDQQPFDAHRPQGSFVALQQARAKLEAERFDMLLRTREVLSAEQWGRLKDFVQERAAGREQGRSESRPLRRWRP